jgi:hypothetical protein
MHNRGLLFHPDDRPGDLVRISDTLLFKHHGDAVYEFAFDAVSQTFHTSAERKTITAVSA